jgi:hypothetical protein
MKRLFFTHRSILIGLTVWGTTSMEVSAQHDPTPPFKGKLGKTLAETQQSWPDRYTKVPYTYTGKINNVTFDLK